MDQLASDAVPDAATLREVYPRFNANYPGLEHPAFRDAARALEEHISLLEVSALPDPGERHARLMEAMAQALETYDSQPSPEKARAIQDGLTWLRTTDQAHDLVEQVVARHAFPNLLVDISARFVSAGLILPVDRTQRIYDQILGATVTGQGRMTGTLRGTLQDDPRRGSILLNVSGRIDANTVARKSPVTVWGKGVTTFTAFKTLVFEQTGLSGGASRSCTRSNNRVTCVDAPLLIKPLARMQLKHQRDEANHITAQRARPVINQQLDQDADSIIASANQAYVTEFRNPLLRTGAFPRRMEFRTSESELNVVILQAADGQLGAPQPPPQLELRHDVGAQMHETAFNNLAESLLSGVTMTDEDVRANVLKYLTMASLEEYALEKEEQPWEITFARQSPIAVSFRENAYTMTIAGDAWKSGRRSFRNLNATVTYQIDSKQNNVRLIRDEEILIAPPGFIRGKDRLSPLVISPRRVLQRKLDQLFPPVIEPDQLVVPGPWEQAGPLKVVDMDAKSGWLRVSWVMQTSTVATSSDRSVTSVPRE